MNSPSLAEALDRVGDLIELSPEIVARFYGDGNRLGQRPQNATKPLYYKPERWIGSSMAAANPREIPSGGLSSCKALKHDEKDVLLRDLLAHETLGPRLLGEQRFDKHQGKFLALIKLLDASCPIPFHVHADDAFIAKHPKIYPQEKFGKDEAYHFLEAPKGPCPYTHIGLRAGIDVKQVIAAMNRSTDHVVELSPGTMQNFGEGFFVKSGLLHRPGTAVTLEIQQPSDAYAHFQFDFDGRPIPLDAMHPGFSTLEECAENIVDWPENLRADLLESSRIIPTPYEKNISGGAVEWIFPPRFSKKFSGLRLTVQTYMKFSFDQPAVLYVWRGRGTLNGNNILGGGGPAGQSDEFFAGISAMKHGLEIRNTGEEPLVIFAMFAAQV